MDMKLLNTLIEAAGYEAYSYSGRGMFGRKCVGFTCPDVNTAIADLFEVVFEVDLENIANEEEEYDARMSIHNALCKAVRKSASDSMDLDMVLYFKSVEWQDEKHVAAELEMEPAELEMERKLANWLDTVHSNDRDKNRVEEATMKSATQRLRDELEAAYIRGVEMERKLMRLRLGLAVPGDN